MVEEKNIWNFFHNLFDHIGIILFILWFIALGLQFINFFSSGEYKLLLNYGQIALTLFGFTLIGGIFEKKQEHEYIEKKLFTISISFLTVAICFFFMFSMASFFEIDITVGSVQSIIILGSFTIAMAIAYYGFVSGFINLYQLLLEYRGKLEEK